VFLRAGKSGYRRRAVQSLGLWLIAFAALSAAGVMAAFAYYTSDGEATYRTLAVLLGVASWTLASVGVMYSLGGLRETDKKLKQRRRHGRRFAGCSSAADFWPEACSKTNSPPRRGRASKRRPYCTTRRAWPPKR
jgi:hypothetical protein